MRNVFGAARWLGLSLLWGTLLLGGLLLCTFGLPAASAMAAPSIISAQSSTIAFASGAYTVNEGDGTATIALQVDPPSSAPITVTVASSNIQAEASEDFVGLRQSLVIAPSQPAYTLSLDLIDDELVEGDEQLQLSLGDYRGVSSGIISQTIVTIQDNDVAYLSIGDAKASEGAGSVSLLITQSVTSTLDSLVDVRTIAGSATTPQDFKTLLTTARIPAGSTSTNVTVQLNEDKAGEPSESFFVELYDATNAQIARPQATVTLFDDDSLPQLASLQAGATEAQGVLPFVVTLSSSWPQTVTVNYATRDGSATAPNDYLATTGILTFPPGAISETVSIPVVQDQQNEPDEDLFLDLSNPVQATLGSTQIEGIIRDSLGADFGNHLFLPGVMH